MRIISISRGKSEGRLEGAKRPTAGDEPREFTSRGEEGRVPPFIELRSYVYNSSSVWMPEMWRRLSSLRKQLPAAAIQGRHIMRRSHQLIDDTYLLNNSGKLNDSWRKRFLPSVEMTASFVIPNECEKSRIMLRIS